MKSLPSKSALLVPVFCGLLAVGVRLPSPISPEAADPWVRGALSLQGLTTPGASGPSQTDLGITLPLVLGQNAGYLWARLTGRVGEEGPGAWIRAHAADSGRLLRVIWVCAAACAAFLAVGALQGGVWGLLAGVLVAITPTGLVGTQRLEGWALASVFGLLVLRDIPRPLAVAAWGGLLSLTPLGFLFALAGVIGGPRERRFQILMAIPLWFALVPARLMEPFDAVTGIPAGLASAGWPGWGAGPAGRALMASWTPGIGMLVLGLMAGVSLRRERDHAVALIAVLLLWTFPAAVGSRRPDGVGLVAPVAIALGVIGARAVTQRAVRGRRELGFFLASALLALGLVASAGTLRALAGRQELGQAVTSLVAREVGRAGRLVRDPNAPALPESIAAFTLPAHAQRADVYDFAWWPGWFGDFTHMLISARAVESIERDPARRPVGRALLLALQRHATKVGGVGDPVTDRSAVLLFRLTPGAPWQPGDRAAAWKEVPGAPEPARYVGDLGAFLVAHGQTQSAVGMFRIGLNWDDHNPRLWNNLGSSLLLIGEAREAAAAFESGLRVEPQSVELRYGLARAYLQAKIPGRAELELRRVLTAQPSFAAAHYEMARVAAANERWAEVVLALEGYLANEPNPSNRTQVEASLAEARRRAGSRH